MSPLEAISAMSAPAGVIQRSLAAAMTPQRYLAHVADLPCLICLHFELRQHGVHVHHQRAGTGFGRASDWDVMPLCPEHHQGKTGIHGMGSKRFARDYGFLEADLVRITQQLVWNKIQAAEAQIQCDENRH